MASTLGSGVASTGLVTDWQSFPSLEITTDINDVFQTLFWGRLSIMLTGQDTVWTAWAEHAQTNGDDDDKWFADRYSGYVMLYEYTNTQAVVVTDYGTLWNDGSGTGATGIYNGWCLQDIRTATNNGGHCLFPNDVDDGTGATAATVRMEAADFAALKTMWTDQSVSDGSPVTSDK